MKIDIFPDAAAAARAAALLIAAEARAAADARGRFVMAVSGGHTPWLMLRVLADENLPWNQVHFVQVDERVAPRGDSDRNLTHLLESLSGKAAISPENIHAMPVESSDLKAACQTYAQLLQKLTGNPAVLDLVHLGLGPDGHTASLVPGDPVLDVTDVDVAATGVYMKRQRLTLTYPTINRARRILWLVTGADKAERLSQLRSGDHSIPAGRVNQAHATVIADQAAAAQLK